MVLRVFQTIMFVKQIKLRPFQGRDPVFCRVSSNFVPPSKSITPGFSLSQDNICNNIYYRSRARRLPMRNTYVTTTINARDLMDVKFTAASLYIITSTTTMMTVITFLTLGARGFFEAPRYSLIFMLISAIIKFSLLCITIIVRL